MVLPNRRAVISVTLYAGLFISIFTIGAVRSGCPRLQPHIFYEVPQLLKIEKSTNVDTVKDDDESTNMHPACISPGHLRYPR